MIVFNVHINITDTKLNPLNDLNDVLKKLGIQGKFVSEKVGIGTITLSAATDNYVPESKVEEYRVVIENILNKHLKEYGVATATINKEKSTMFFNLK